MVFTDKWWAEVIRGIAAVVFGLMAFAVPGITVGALVLLFAAYAMVDGIFALAAAIGRPGRTGHWGAMLLRGVLGILASITAVVWPGITALALLYVIAAWAIVTGVVEISAAIRLRKVITNEWLLIISGVVSVLFGLALIARPGVGILAVVWLIGAYAMIFGVLMIALGFELRSLGRRREAEFEERRAA
jgi:uncharacterized membrane protein HdeD (DUF308 family)